MVLETFDEYKERTMLENKLEFHHLILNHVTKRYDTCKSITAGPRYGPQGPEGLLNNSQFMVPIGKVGYFSVEDLDADKLGSNYPTEIQEGFDMINVNLKEWTYFPKKINMATELENCNFKNLLFMKDSILHGDVRIYDCLELTSLEGLPFLGNNVLSLNNCPKLKTLYDVLDVLDINLNDTGISDVEYNFWLTNRLNINKETYWKDLYMYIVKKQSYKDSLTIPWPKEIFETFPKEYQNLFNSSNAITKFNI